jgi:WD40 repeat protein
MILIIIITTPSSFIYLFIILLLSICATFHYRYQPQDVYDLAWSPDSFYIVTASVDNIVRIWDIRKSKCIKEIREHDHYVQGVTWDPRGAYLATQSSDR